ncbi:MAG: M20/M25/M40 family metallo-hydrolase, partial [Bacteroidetes bacterium]|nr:M20/M25/M40 family metallo-hydrolase [Bacteroidota bacterium]
MIKKILGLLGLILLVFIVIILFNTFRSKPWPVSTLNKELISLPDSAVQHMSQAIQIPTVSYSDTLPIDTAAYLNFGSFINKSYPLIRQHLTKTMVDSLNFVFEWKGENTSLAPIILMGHYDVVPVEKAVLDKWVVPPFSGKITDSCIWGRGSVDDKSGVISILEATEAMLRKNFLPQRTIFLCFGHDEEISGSGARAIVKYLEQRNIKPELVLDEGGEITEDKIKDVKRPVAVIGVAEKGYASYVLSVEKEGGHSSKPDKETAIDILVKALYNLRSKTPDSRITPPVKEFLHRVSSSSDLFVNRMAAANMWVFEGITKKVLSANPEGNAMIHTTLVPTILQSGIKDNVIPSTATAVVNSRILTGETSKTVEEFIRKAINDDRVKIKSLAGIGADPSPATSIESSAFKRVENAIHKTIPNVI